MGVTYLSDVTEDTLEPYFVTLTRIASRDIADAMQENVRFFIPTGGGDAPGRWRGWEATGELWSAIVKGNDRRYGDNWKSKVRIRKGSRAEIYAGIHETGGFIFMNNVLMKFEGKHPVTGANLGTIYKEVVYIRPKGFFQKGRDKTERELQQTLDNVTVG